VLAVGGELDLATAPSLKWAVSEELRAPSRHVVLDLAGVEFMDSTAIGVLVGLQRSLAEGQWLALANLRPDVRMTFELTGLEGMFELFATVEGALARSAELRPGSGRRAQSS
jgi:anti-sigma B factor antagonist